MSFRFSIASLCAFFALAHTDTLCADHIDSCAMKPPVDKCAPPKSFKDEPRPLPPSKAFMDEKTGLYGYKNDKGQVVIKPQFLSAFDFAPSNCTTPCWTAVRIKRPDDNPEKDRRLSNLPGFALGDFYIIGTSGHIIAKAYFDDNGPDYISPWGVVRICDKNPSEQKLPLVGVLHRFGRITVSPQYTDIMPFHNKFPGALAYKGGKVEIEKGDNCCRADVHTGGKWGVIDTGGKVVVPFEFDSFKRKSDKTGESIILFKNDKGTVRSFRLRAKRDSKFRYTYKLIPCDF
jgi:hypothetical protein